MRADPRVFSGFSGGINLIDPQYELSDRECRDARNVIATRRGAIKKRAGNATFANSSPATAIESLYAGTSPALLIAQQGTTLNSYNTSGVSASLATGLTAAARWEWVRATTVGAPAQGPYFGVNGVDPPRFVTSHGVGGLWTLAAGGVPQGRFPQYHSNRILLAGAVGATGSTVSASKILDPRTFASPDGWAVTLDGQDGFDLTATGTVGPYVLAFKENKTWVIFDIDTGANRRLSESVGCIASRSVVETPRGTMWLARDGIYRTNGSTIERVSERIQPLLDMLVAANMGQACAAYFEEHYYLSISTTGAANNLVLDYDLTLDCWWIHSVPTQQFAVWQLSTGQQLMGARLADTVVQPPLGAVRPHRIDQFFIDGLLQDSGANYFTYWSSPFYSFGSPYVRKRLRRIYFDGKGFIRVALATDFATASTPVGDLTFTQGTSTDIFGTTSNFGGANLFGGGAIGTIPKTVEQGLIYTPTPGVGRTFSVTLSNDTADALQVESYTLNLMTRKN